MSGKVEMAWIVGLIIGARLLFLISGVLFLGQILVYFYKGEWPAQPILAPFKSMGIEWASNPQSWLVAHKVVSFVSWPGGLFLMGCVFLCLGFLIANRS